MPDETEIEFAKTLCIQVPELIFKPELDQTRQYQQEPLQTLIASTINYIDSDFRTDYARNVILTGRTSCMPGFVTRLRAELGPDLKVVFSERDAQCGVWRGASTLAASFKDNNWFSREEYEEEGAAGIHKYAE